MKKEKGTMKKLFFVAGFFLIASAMLFAQTEEDFTVQASSSSPGSLVITGYKGSSKDMVIPEKIQGLPVAEIGRNAFADMDIASLTIPNTVVKIGAGAFAGAKLPFSVTIPDSVKTIEGRKEMGSTLMFRAWMRENRQDVGAFEESTIRDVVIPSSVTEMGEGVFLNCKQLTSVTFQAGFKLTSIPNSTFRNCGSLAGIEIPSSVTFIDMYAFNGSGIKSIMIPQNVAEMGAVAFGECPNLTEVTFTGSRLKLVNCFMRNRNLVTVTIPSGAAYTFNEYTFRNCPKLSIPSQVAVRQTGYKGEF